MSHTRDYAKSAAMSGASGGRHQPVKQRRKLIILTVLAISLAILLPLGMYIIKYQQQQKIRKPVPVKSKTGSSTTTTVIQPTEKNPAKKSLKAQTQAPNQTPDFDFYHLLSTITVPTGSSSASTLATTLSSGTNGQLAVNNYILQVASVQHLDDAKRLVKRLQSLGFATTIHIRPIKTTVWYRIWVGPYHSLIAANRAKQQLTHNEQLEPLLLTNP